jgi:three-Cys-motif partner protein
LISSLQQFGDSTWTQDKLERVRKYLVAYSTILSKRSHKFAYIDAFAGTGYHELKKRKKADDFNLYPEEDEPAMDAFLDGSARIALQVKPCFHKYIFIEKCPRKAAELEKLKEEFPEKRNDIIIETKDANTYLQELCRRSWKERRAVLFLDPFGMQVEWKTLEAVANTQAIDTWILFPVSGVNRLLKQDGKIPAGWRQRLDTMFGEASWFDVFFPKRSLALFDTDERDKIASIDRIGKHFNDRLSSLFAGVAKNPYTLFNSKGAPLFLLCFAAANPHAAKTAIKIAQDILKRELS